MSLSYKSKRRWALVILLIALPLYVVLAISVIGMFDRPSILIELGIYLGLGILWALPFRAIFRGVGQDDPNGDENNSERRR